MEEHGLRSGEPVSEEIITQIREQATPRLPHLEELREHYGTAPVPHEPFMSAWVPKEYANFLAIELGLPSEIILGIVQKLAISVRDELTAGKWIAATPARRREQAFLIFEAKLPEDNGNALNDRNIERELSSLCSRPSLPFPTTI
ncbi:hypothetical protein [Mesorhizobium retamae]|uniref:Uncharacterized protein n=1 Tax=Mesorhizobium retamae TaxID=2912854 RepID=A0ABS9Q7K7_9HYPH|nr:hypothetical protein [Mesorhizobium sp. IRAMC:0171]MCG7503401.1 hypothetical protein [Mesorhizobium sp. IRAMC:0171]